MIQALVSGQAARIAFIEGTDVSFINADRPDEEIPSSLEKLSAIFLGANDLEEVRVHQPSDAYASLVQKFYVDRGLHLFDVVLCNGDDDLKLEAAELFEQIIEQHTGAYECIRNVIFAAYNDELPTIDELALVQPKAPRTVKLIEELTSAQFHINNFKVALDAALLSVGVAEPSASEFRAHAIHTGSFRSLVEAGGDASHINRAILGCFTALAGLPNSRSVILSWTKDVIHKTTKTEIRRLEAELERYEVEGYSPHSSDERSAYEKYQAVKRQISAIVEKIRQRDVRKARRFADQLIGMQLQNSGAEYAVKSLSAIAVEARKMGQHSLELEWAARSVELGPEDGRAVGILADTYLQLFRIPEAEEAFKKAIALGELEFGSVGLGRVRRVSGRYEEALAIFEEAIERFAEDNINVWPAPTGWSRVNLSAMSASAPWLALPATPVR